MKSAEGWEDSGVVMALPEAVEMAERGTYDRQGEAQIKVKQSFWAGTSTIQLRVRRVSTLYAIVSCRRPLIKYLVAGLQLH